MDTIKMEAFAIIGISVRTTNENGQAGKDLPFLWNKFLSEDIIAQIPNKTDTSVYCVYTDYVKDHTAPYTAILGCRVENLNDIPDGMVGKQFHRGIYKPFVAKGNIQEGIVFREWNTIWNTPLDRTFKADFEVYGQKAANPEQAEVDIFIGVS